MLNYKLKIGVLPIRRLIKEPPKRIGMFQSDCDRKQGRNVEISS